MIRPSHACLVSAALLLNLLSGCGTPPLAMEPMPELGTGDAIAAGGPVITLLASRPAPSDVDLTTAVKIERHELNQEKLNDDVRPVGFLSSHGS